MGQMFDFEAFRALMAARHSEYHLAPEWVVSQESVEGMLGDLLQQMPTHFNCQPVRVVLLTGAAHARHWDLVAQALLAKIGQARFDDGTKQKIATSFASGVATLLFYDDTAITQRMVAQFPGLAANFPKWAQQVQGSHQYMAWLGLVGLGFGANVQHYIGLADAEIATLAHAHPSWQLVAQMPFGRVVEAAVPKKRLPIQEVLSVVDCASCD